MAFSRRTLLQRAAAGSALIAARGRVSPALAQSTPVASPALGVAPLLVSADDAIQLPDGTQFIAVMPGDAFERERVHNGVINLDLERLALADTSVASVEAWTAEMRELMGVRGIRADRPAVIYDEGSIFAARGWWQLAYLGYDLPRVLDGGMPAWDAAGGEIDSGPVSISPLEAPPLVDVPVRRHLLATKDDVLALLDDPGGALLDVRAPKEYTAGHIPGAVNLPYVRNASEAAPQLFKSPDALREMYAALGVTPEKRVITYCTTGVRGSVGFFSLKLAGFEDVALYLGSWGEWDADPDTPKETG